MHTLIEFTRTKLIVLAVIATLGVGAGAAALIVNYNTYTTNVNKANVYEYVQKYLTDNGAINSNGKIYIPTADSTDGKNSNIVVGSTSKSTGGGEHIIPELLRRS
jgi:hypothetical protein